MGISCQDFKFYRKKSTEMIVFLLFEHPYLCIKICHWKRSAIKSVEDYGSKELVPNLIKHINTLYNNCVKTPIQTRTSNI